MTTLERLRASDPARDLDPAPPEELLRAIVATPRPEKRRRRRAPLALVAAGAAIAAAFVALGGGSTDLAARAYAQTAPGPDTILYVRTKLRMTIEIPGREDEEVSNRERWQRGERWRSVLRLDGRVYEEVRGADGVLRFSDGETARREDGGEAKEYIERGSIDFLTQFRTAYRSGKLDEGGDTRFAGRPAKRYVVTSPNTRNRAEYFIDAETGMPLGSRDRLEAFAPEIGPDRRPRAGKSVGFHVQETLVEAIEQLPPTPENVAKLSGTG